MFRKQVFFSNVHFSSNVYSEDQFHGERTLMFPDLENSTEEHSQVDREQKVSLHNVKLDCDRGKKQISKTFTHSRGKILFKPSQCSSLFIKYQVYTKNYFGFGLAELSELGLTVESIEVI